MNWTITAVLALLLLWGIGYAWLVRWMSAHQVSGQTAYLVVLGVLVTVLASSALIGLQDAVLVLACFGASGAPMIVEFVSRVHLAQSQDKASADAVARDLLK